MTSAFSNSTAVNSGSAILQTGGSVTLPVTVGAVAGLAQPLMQQAKDVACKGAALAALADPAINKIQLSIDGFTISPASYAQVRQKINSGSIQVKFNSRLSNGPNGYPYAFYHAPTNVLNLGFSTATTAPRKGLIVHEATHAACDIVPYSSMTTVTSEVLAYIAQAIFMLEKDPFPEVQADPDHMLRASPGRHDQIRYPTKSLGSQEPARRNFEQPGVLWQGCLTRL